MLNFRRPRFRPTVHNNLMGPAIRNISDTALWAATFRAQETDRPDALFRDPFAARLAGDRGRHILETVPHAGDNSWAWVIRTYLFDRVIRDRVAAGTRQVLNMAAGLDARPYRMDLPADLRWVEVDLPDLISYKQDILAADRPGCRFERIPLDLADREARRPLLQRLGRGLAISEGLLIYLTDGQVGDLASDLARAGFDYWLFDLASPALLQMLRATSGRATEEAGAPLRFAPENRTAFFEPFGWKAAQVHSVFDAALETGRIPRDILAAGPPPLPSGVTGEIWNGACLLERA